MFCHVFNYLLKNYATDNVIAEAEVDITRFRQKDGMNMTPYAESLWEKAVHCEQAYDESRLKGILMNGLYNSFCFSIQNFWSANKYAALRDLAR